MAIENPIWSALATRQTALGRAHGAARRFAPDVNMLAGFADEGTPVWRDLAVLVESGSDAGVFVHAVPAAIEGFAIVATAPLLQMLYAGAALDDATTADPRIAPLGEADAAEILALATLTKPGPFLARTHTMGDFLGIRDDGGALVAMAGQRLRVPGHVEISAICTHPDHLGRGLAAALTRRQIYAIAAAGDRPFLHVRGDNARAIALYERLGFVASRRGTYAILRRS